MSTETANATSARAVVFPAIDPEGEPEGFASGHAAGYAAGLRRAEAEASAREAHREAEHAAALAAHSVRIDRALAALEAAASALDERTAPVLADAEAQLAHAAIALSEAVIGHELSDAPHGARTALARALSAPHSAGAFSVRLHPADLALLRHDAVPGVDLVPDPGLAPGDAVAVYPEGELDARIATALARAAAALLGEGE